MIKELTSMMLEMWSSRCGCLHGHTKAEKKIKRREMLGTTVRKCYGRRGEVLLEHQEIFDQPVEEMIKARSPQYLRAWINMFYSFVFLSDRERQSGNPVEEVEKSPLATFDTWYMDGDLDEYLVDATDGMEREWEMGAGEAELTPPVEIRVQNPYIKKNKDKAGIG